MNLARLILYLVVKLVTEIRKKDFCIFAAMVTKAFALSKSDFILHWTGSIGICPAV